MNSCFLQLLSRTRHENNQDDGKERRHSRAEVDGYRRRGGIHTELMHDGIREESR